MHSLEMILRDSTPSVGQLDRRVISRMTGARVGGGHRGLVYLFPPFSSPLKHFRSFDPE